jgi:HEAT repeat protein
MAAAESPAMVNWLTVLLNDPSGLCRFAAQNALLRTGEAAGPAILPLLDPRRREVYAALAVAIHLASLEFTQPALRLTQHASHRLRAPAATLLGKLGGPEATQRLVELLDDSAPEVRMASVHALADLGHWPASSHIATLLRDRDWRVRREAGFGLLRLGSPGRLLLQRYTADSDRYAASMATHVLDVARFSAEAYA